MNERARRELLIRGGGMFVLGLLLAGFWVVFPVSYGAPLDFFVVTLGFAALLLGVGGFSIFYYRRLLRAVGRTWDAIHFDYGTRQEHLPIDGIRSMKVLEQSFLRRPIEVQMANGQQVLITGASKALGEDLIRFVGERQAEGAPLGGLSPEPLGPDRIATRGPAMAARARHVQPSGPWGISVLPDGREVPDSPMVMESREGGVERPVGAWMSWPAQTSRALALLAIATVGVLPFVFAIPSLGFAGAVPALGVAAAASVALELLVLRYTYYQLKGQSGFAVLVLPPSAATQQEAGDLVRRSAQGAGIRGPPLFKRGMWTSWRLGRAITFRFIQPMGVVPARLTVQTMKGENAALHARLKGHVLANLGVAPPIAEGPARPAFPAPRMRARLASEPPTFEPFRRAAPGAPVRRPAKWEFSTPRDGSAPVPDAALPASGAADAPLGWWASAEPSMRLDAPTRIVLVALLLTTMILPGLILGGVVTGGSSAAVRSSEIALVLIMGAFAVGLAGLAYGIFRWQRRHDREARGESCLRLGALPAGPEAVVARVDDALRTGASWVRPRPASKGELARWADAGTSLTLVFEDLGPAGGALLRLNSTRRGDEVAGVKGVLEAALTERPE